MQNQLPCFVMEAVMLARAENKQNWRSGEMVTSACVTMANLAVQTPAGWGGGGWCERWWAARDGGHVHTTGATL